MATKRKNVSLAPDLEFISKDTGLDVETITEKAIREFIARYKLEKIRNEMSSTCIEKKQIYSW
jgi:dephospho-CoA kinase